MEHLKASVNVQRLRTRLVPPTVAEFIDIANSAGALESKDTPDPFLALQADMELSMEDVDAAGSEHNATLLYYMKGIEAAVQNWDDPARGYVLAHGKSLDHDLDQAFRNMRDRYQHVSGIRDLLIHIADENSSAIPRRPDLAYSLPWTIWILLSLTVVQRPRSKRSIRPGRDTEIGHAGVAVIEPQEPFRQFLKEVELDRIKRCAYEKCRRIFWAGRADRPCCSESCRNAHKQKKHREREKQNRPYRKRLLKKRSK
jgi:hypothetical protein